MDKTPKTVQLEMRIEYLLKHCEEQNGTIKDLEYLLRRTIPVLEVANDQQELIAAIDALLGGKE